jgi:outer membrane protein OmpA-like peptidoglycan-associated protein
MKKMYAIIMVMIVVLGFISCGGSEQPQPQPRPVTTTTAPPAQTVDFDAIRQQINRDMLFRIEVYNFPPDSWNLQDSMGPTLTKLGNILKKLITLAKKINAANKIKITVIGYSDTSGTQKRKMTVSENRAKKVIDHLVEKEGLQRALFVAKWRGDQELKVPGEPLSGQNRRVVVYFEGIRN